MRIAQIIIDGNKFVLTGFRDKELEKYIEDNGGYIITSVSKETSLVIANDINSDSTKIKNAKKKNVKIIAYDKIQVNI